MGRALPGETLTLTYGCRRRARVLGTFRAKKPLCVTPASELLDLGFAVLPNRIIMGSMHTGLEAQPDGIPRLAAYFAERAEGGAALMVTGGFSPNDAGNLGRRAQFWP